MANELITLVEAKQQSLWQMRASYMPKNIDVDMYFRRSLSNILENNELQKMSTTPDGAKKILMCLSKALQMGLQIGGVIPQAYIVPMPTKDGMKPTLIPTVDGYRFVALSDPPILKDFFISAVYEKEVGNGFRIDMPNGKVEGHFVFLGPDRGKMIGVYAILTHLDNTKTAQWMPIQDIENVRNHHSPSWKAYKNDKMSADKCAWVTDADMMSIKTAGKRFLEPYVALKEGLQMVLNIDEDDTANGAQEQDKRPIVDRVGDKLDDIIETTAKVEMTAEEPKTEVKQNGQDNKDGSLF